MLKKQPYFMKNPEWYYHDEEEWKYKLTDKAPKEAVESYNQFYNDDVDMGLYNSIMTEVEKDYREDLRKQGKSEEQIEEIITKWKSE